MANYVRISVAENVVIFSVQLQQTKDVRRRNFVVEFPQKFPRVSVSTVDVCGGKLDVGVVTEARYLPQNVLGVLAKRLVMPDEVVVNVTRLTEVVLRPPVMVDALLSQTSLLHNVLDKLVKFQIVSGLQRSEKPQYLMR